MIQHIYEDLLTKLDSYKFNQGSDVWAEYVANELLGMVEGFGMLPPIIGNKAAFDTVEEEILPRWEDEE